MISFKKRILVIALKVLKSYMHKMSRKIIELLICKENKNSVKEYIIRGYIVFSSSVSM